MTGDLLSLAGPAPAAVPRSGLPPGAADRAGSDGAASAIDFESLVTGFTEASPGAEHEKQNSTADEEAATALHTGPEISGIALGLVVPSTVGSPSPVADVHDDAVETETLAIDVTDAGWAGPSDETDVPVSDAPARLLPDPWHPGPTSGVPRDTAVADAATSSPTGAEHARPRSVGGAETATDAAPGVSEGNAAAPRAGDVAPLSHGAESADPVKGVFDAGDASAPGRHTARHNGAPGAPMNSSDDNPTPHRESATGVNTGEAGVWGRVAPGDRSDVGRPRRTVASFDPGHASAGRGSGDDNEPTAWSAPQSAAPSSEISGMVQTSRPERRDTLGRSASRGTTTMDVAPAFLLAHVTGSLGGTAFANFARYAADNASGTAAEYGPFPAEPAQQVVKAVRLQWSEGIGEARLKLHPEHLGGLSIRLRVEQGAVTASVRADSTAAAEWIRVNRADLEASLAAQGLALDTLEVIVDPDDRRRRQSSPETSDDLRPPRRRRSDHPRFEIHV